MRALLDVNVLIALHDADHVHHDIASAWFQDHAAAGWSSCPLTQNGALRIMSQPVYPSRRSLPLLLQMFSRTFAAPEHIFWADDISLCDAGVVDSRRLHGHRQLTDIYLLALAVKHGGRFVTMDTAVDRLVVSGATTDHLVKLSN